MRYLLASLSLFFSLLYFWTESSLIKMLPAITLAFVAPSGPRRRGLMLSGIGDFLLDQGYFSLSLYFFGACHYSLLPPQIETPWPLIYLSAPLILSYPTFKLAVIPIIKYAWSLAYLVWNSEGGLFWGSLLYTIADLIILLHLVLKELNIGSISLIIYWLSLWIIALTEPPIQRLSE